nr:glycosyltransferase [Enterococcus rivorum]
MDEMKTKKINVNLNENYLEKRFELFRKYTIPSIKGQTTKNFIWVVMFHKKTPKKFLNQIFEMKQEMSFFHPIFIDDNENIERILNEYLLSNKSEAYLTSRIDNDDSLHKEYIEVVQKILSNSTQKKAISFPYGMQYSENHQILSKYIFEHNHFTTLFSKYNGEDILDTINNYNHMTLSSQVSVDSIILDKPMWLEVVHKDNISNRMKFRRKDIVERNSLINDFSLDISIQKRSESNYYLITLYSVSMGLIRHIKKHGFTAICYKIKKLFVKLVKRDQ